MDIDLINPSPHQPRMAFNETALSELAQSIITSGIIQPVLLRRMGSRYQLIAGERRWRAAQKAGLHSVPAIVRDVPDEQAVEMTLIENLQREDLNPLEEATAYDRLMHEFGMTQDQVAERTGKSRSTISNTLRILRLEPEILQLIGDGKLSGSHARALATVNDPAVRLDAAKKAGRGHFSVRQIERLNNKTPKTPHVGSVDPHDPNVKHMLNLMEQKYGTKIGLKMFMSGNGGQLIFYFYENEYLGTLYDLMMNGH